MIKPIFGYPVSFGIKRLSIFYRHMAVNLKLPRKADTVIFSLSIWCAIRSRRGFWKINCVPYKQKISWKHKWKVIVDEVVSCASADDIVQICINVVTDKM